MHKQPDTCRKVGRAEYDKHAENMSNTNTENTKWRTFSGDLGHKHRHIYVFMYNSIRMEVYVYVHTEPPIFTCTFTRNTGST